jgi:hypothetical protein
MRIGSVQQDDDGACGFVDDLVDQVERMLRASAESYERDVRALSRGDSSHVLDVDLAGDHLVTESDDDRNNKLKAVLAFVRDENAQRICRVSQRCHERKVKHFVGEQMPDASLRATPFAVLAITKSPEPSS